ncbi:MAG TPA: 3-deoxy-D-manno-octulosonic acid transferase [Stellaceae bacterium]|jgi:3-deoxy-D-manno-octulosonic-acid transferase|nr:3-deoxy-D-manno-octulosonic acid transferase [Stellaceae bacterium]
MLPALYRAVTTLATPLVLAGLAWRRRQGKEDPVRFGERLGFPSLPRPQGPLVWVHAASVGEATSVLALIQRVMQDRAGLEILLTTGTVASARLIEPRLPDGVRHQFVPVDLPGAVDRFLGHWRPDLAIWVESELWPNLVMAAHRRGIPTALVNARLSARSHARWLAMPGLARRMLGGFAVCLAQDEVQTRRFRQLGAAAAESVGDLKSAAEDLPADPDALAGLRAAIGARPAWLAASTHGGEEDEAVAAHGLAAAAHPGLLTVIAPRHPVRGETIAAAIRRQGLGVARRSRGEPIGPETDIYLVDTLGELGLFYRLAGIAFVGGSLVDRGGHNPFEAARLDCAVLHGPFMGNCVAMAAALAVDGGAELVGDGATLGAAVSRLLSQPELRAARAQSAARVAAASLGTLDAIVARLDPYLDALAPTLSRPAPSPPAPHRLDAQS